MVGGGEHNDIGQEVLGMTTGRRQHSIGCWLWTGKVNGVRREKTRTGNTKDKVVEIKGG